MIFAETAAANGRYPEANQLVVGVVDPARILVRATFGFSISADAGATWSWVCEQAIGYNGVLDPPVAFLAGDAAIAGLPTGVSFSSDLGCTWGTAAAMLPMEYVVDVTAERSDPTRALAITTTNVGNALDSYVARTIDGGATWQVTGDDLGSDFRAATIEVAPSNPSRLYASGLLEPSYEPALAVSDDGGQTWTRYVGLGLPGPPFVSAIDPTDPNRVYARVPGDDVDGVYLSTDGGQSFQEVVQRPGRILGFALSPDGTRLAIGGPGFGIESADAFALEFASRSTYTARCLTWAATGLYVCGDEAIDGFTVGLSTDEGATIAPLLNLAELSPIKCGTAVATCEAYWPGIAEQLGIVLPPPSAASSGSTGGDGATGDEGDGCGCHLPPRDPAAWPLVAAWVLWLARRARRRARV